MRRVVSDYHGRPLMSLCEFGADERKIEPMFRRGVPRHEAAVVTAVLLIANETMVVQFLTGKDHRGLGRSKEAVVCPKGATDETCLPDNHGLAMQKMDADLVSEFAPSCQAALQLALVELMIAGDVNDLSVTERTGFPLFHHPLESSSDRLVHVAGEDRDIELRHRFRKGEWTELEMQIGNHQQAHPAFPLHQNDQRDAPLIRLALAAAGG